MGMTHEIRFASLTAPGWEAIASRLRSVGESPVIRMIDGLPAFPDEVPEPAWRELRIGLAGGMITLRRTSDGFACVAWGNAESEQQRSWDRLAWACADAAEGLIVTPTGSVPAADFARAAHIFPA